MYFSTRSYDVRHVAIVAFVPVIMRSSLFSKYLVVEQPESILTGGYTVDNGT